MIYYIKIKFVGNVSITERVERLVEAWRKRTKEYREIYKEGTDIMRTIHRMQKRQRELDFSDAEYSVLMELERRFGSQRNWPDEVRKLFDRFRPYMLDGWITQGALRKSVERELRRFVRKLRKEYGLSMEEMDLLYTSLWERVKYYGVMRGV